MKYSTIVIDDSSIQRLATSFLVKNHTKLELIGSYANPYEGIKAIYDYKVDIVFLDVLMDQVDAFELLDSIEINAAIIMNSTWSHFAQPAFEYGINDFLIKPMPKKRFEQAVDKIIKQIQLEREIQKQSSTFLFSELLSNFN
ncbi:LytR/AlgR family response regulator transcription factor [Croceitalea rosinachiae]|uniref:Response regulator n=1 Tax=Croceitalea rosinachiae TaxID=3075596 RepID=A0ABU3AEG1_9FLAO|nr:response regulator [Croceitalea sp. F388]MDT0608384.1 response regulator [Croceitalea sp. F388]